ncbi:MAG: helix-turn-helix domain-containing protein [Candidatus Diapherotrites archaeon]|nr:helix-turn-helix domain-containing protein [Candidatus Diapherotrites archaeon]
MDENLKLVIASYKGILEQFSKSIAKVYLSLLTSDVKTAIVIQKETQLQPATVYYALINLEKNGLIKKTNSMPASYFCSDPIKAFEQIAKTKVLNERKQKLEQVILNTSNGHSIEYVIKIGNGNQTKLINQTTMQEASNYKELIELKQRIEQKIKEIPESEKQLVFNGRRQL